MNIYKCYNCGKEFQSNKEPKKIGKNSKLIGYVCENCSKKQTNAIFKSSICSNCKSSLGEVKPYQEKSEIDTFNDIWVKMDYICPNCSSRVSIVKKIGSISHLEINSVMLERYKDESIKKIYDLYTKGFKIIGKQYSSNNKQEIRKTFFAKGDERRELVFSEATKEFSSFWAHIQFVYDKNLRRIPTLIEPNKYWSNSVIPQKFDDIIIEISGFSFSELLILTLPKKNVQNPLLRFTISLENEKNKNFLNIDFREPLRFYKKNELIFTGYITTLMKGFNTLNIICQGLSGEFIADKINIKIKAKKNRHLEFMAFLLDNSEMPHHISGLDTEERLYDIITPIIGLNISDKLKIGDCYITNKLPENEFLVKNSFPNKGNFACLSLKRNSFYNAFIDGLKFLQGTLDLINYRIKIPTFLGYYHYFDQRVSIKLGEIIYLKDRKHDVELIIYLPINQSPDYKREILIQDYFKPILKLGEDLIKPGEKITIEKEKLLWILNYLSSAESKTDRIAAFLDLFIALEFTLNIFGVKIDKRFSKPEINELRDYIDDFIPKKKEELKRFVEARKMQVKDHDLKIERYKIIHKRLIQLINSNFNQISLNEQMKALLKKYDLELNEEELKIFKKARQKRNDIVHGKKGVKPTKEEYNIVSKIIYFLVRNTLIESDVEYKI
ncbi:hypothetical protein LCGC14_1333390 [marine sediment metagenome]|uniref:Apea-like HEPN domain-containing protein n=1 Tax=marine sediment metagenome TaxID=412755 RepID=A0A0F9L1X5_9ZZZZ|nr:hypothetical protein [bacterium]